MKPFPKKKARVMNKEKANEIKLLKQTPLVQGSFCENRLKQSCQKLIRKFPKIMRKMFLIPQAAKY